MLVYLLFIKSDEDKSLFEEIFYKFRKQMIYYAFGFVSNEIDAEDIVHDVFLKIAQKNLVVLKKIKSETDIRNYLLKATKNTALNLTKVKSKEVLIDEPVIEEISDEGFVEKVCSHIEYHRILSAINSLSDIYKTVLYYHFVMDLPVKDVASLLGRSISTTKKQLARGKKKLLELLEVEE